MQVSSLQQQGTGQRMHKETSGSYEFYEGDIPHSHQARQNKNYKLWVKSGW